MTALSPSSLGRYFNRNCTAGVSDRRRLSTSAASTATEPAAAGSGPSVIGGLRDDGVEQPESRSAQAKESSEGRGRCREYLIHPLQRSGRSGWFPPTFLDPSPW